MFEPSLQSTRNIALFFPGALSDRVVSPLLSLLFYIPLFLSLSKKPSAVQRARETKDSRKGYEEDKTLDISSRSQKVLLTLPFLSENLSSSPIIFNSLVPSIRTASMSLRLRPSIVLEGTLSSILEELGFPYIYIYILNFFSEISSCMHFSLFFA